jgi:hypothetical protein
VLGMCLAAIYGSPGTAPGPAAAADGLAAGRASQPGLAGASRYGIFRM